MGRQLPPGYVGRAEAAKALGVSVQTLKALVQRGVLAPRMIKGVRGRVYLLEEVQNAELHAGGRADLHKIKAMAIAALSAARRAERRLEEVYYYLGLELTTLDREEPAVQALYEEAGEPVDITQIKLPGWLRRWGGLFFSMDEHYLELVAHVTKSEEPWKVFLDLAARVMRCIHEDREPTLMQAASRFRAGRDHLYHVSYLYCRQVHGRKIANTVFDGEQTAIDELMAILH